MEKQERKRKPTIVTSENREEFMAKKLGLAKKQEPVYEEEENSPKFGVKYHNEKGEEEAVKHFTDEEKAKKYMERGNSVDKVGGKYSLHPIAPVPARKYIKGTEEHKALKEKQKPINGHPTNRRK